MPAGYARFPARMAEWQTLMAQTHLPERACGFDSRSGHTLGAMCSEGRSGTGERSTPTGRVADRPPDRHTRSMLPEDV
jgi:hypothetical protein